MLDKFNEMLYQEFNPTLSKHKQRGASKDKQMAGRMSAQDLLQQQEIYLMANDLCQSDLNLAHGKEMQALERNPNAITLKQIMTLIPQNDTSTIVLNKAKVQDKKEKKAA